MRRSLPKFSRTSCFHSFIILLWTRSFKGTMMNEWEEAYRSSVGLLVFIHSSLWDWEECRARRIGGFKAFHWWMNEEEANRAYGRPSCFHSFIIVGLGGEQDWGQEALRPFNDEWMRRSSPMFSRSSCFHSFIIVGLGGEQGEEDWGQEAFRPFNDEWMRRS